MFICLLCVGIIIAKRGGNIGCAYIWGDEGIPSHEKNIQKLVIEDMQRQIAEFKRDVHELVMDDIYRQIATLNC